MGYSVQVKMLVAELYRISTCKDDYKTKLLETLLYLYFYFQNGGHSLLESKDQYGKTATHYAATTQNVDVS